jgi:hypothetical protein
MSNQTIEQVKANAVVSALAAHATDRLRNARNTVENAATFRHAPEKRDAYLQDAERYMKDAQEAINAWRELGK